MGGGRKGKESLSRVAAICYLKCQYFSTKKYETCRKRWHCGIHRTNSRQQNLLSDLNDKDLGLSTINMSKELKDTVIKEGQESRREIHHQIENINKERNYKRERKTYWKIRIEKYKWDLIKLGNFLRSNENNKNPVDCEKIFAKDMTNKSLISKCTNTSYNSITKKQRKPIKK